MKVKDIVGHIQILAGQKLIIKNRSVILAEYSNARAAYDARYQPYMQLTAGVVYYSNSSIVVQAYERNGMEADKLNA